MGEKRGAHNRSASESGQTIVEFALILPVLLLIVLGMIDFGFIMHSYIVVTQAAREGARAATFGDTDAQISAAVEATAASLNTDQLSLTIAPSGARVTGEPATVAVTYHHNTITPVIHQIWPTIPVKATVTMRVE